VIYIANLIFERSFYDHVYVLTTLNVVNQLEKTRIQYLRATNGDLLKDDQRITKTTKERFKYDHNKDKFVAISTRNEGETIHEIE